MAIKDTLGPEHDREIAITRTLLARLPDDRLAWAPHPRSKPLGELASHLAAIPAWTARIFAGPRFDLDAIDLEIEPSGTAAGLLARFDERAAQSRAALARSDAEYLAVWVLKRGSREIFAMPKIAALRRFVLSHLIHHRGQLSVYLRIADVPLPSIYGPSADAPGFER
jgi:uncharacterized damage-inducible protein DinB